MALAGVRHRNMAGSGGLLRMGYGDALTKWEHSSVGPPAAIGVGSPRLLCLRLCTSGTCWASEHLGIWAGLDLGSLEEGAKAWRSVLTPLMELRFPQREVGGSPG